MPKARTEIFKVSSKTDPNKFAGTIAYETRYKREQLKMFVNVIGAGALNQAIKGLAIAQGFIASTGLTLVTSFSFIDLKIDGAEKTGIQLLIRAIPNHELV